MSQRRQWSLAEALVNVVVGYGISVALTAWLTGASFSTSSRWSAWFVLASLGRAYVVRRAFARWEIAR